MFFGRRSKGYRRWMVGVNAVMACFLFLLSEGAEFHASQNQKLIAMAEPTQENDYSITLIEESQRTAKSDTAMEQRLFGVVFLMLASATCGVIIWLTVSGVKARKMEHKKEQIQNILKQEK